MITWRHDIRRSILASSAIWVFLAVWEPFSCRYAPGDTFFGNCAFTADIVVLINTVIAFVAVPIVDLFWRRTLGSVAPFRTGSLARAFARAITALVLLMIIFVVIRNDLAANYTSPGNWYFDQLNQEMWAHAWPWVFAWLTYSIAMEANPQLADVRYLPPYETKGMIPKVRCLVSVSPSRTADPVGADHLPQAGVTPTPIPKPRRAAPHPP